MMKYPNKVQDAQTYPAFAKTFFSSDPPWIFQNITGSVRLRLDEISLSSKAGNNVDNAKRIALNICLRNRVINLQSSPAFAFVESITLE